MDTAKQGLLCNGLWEAPDKSKADDEPPECNECAAENPRGIDELFATVKEYAASPRFKELLDFTARFKMYAVYNAMLIHLQRPGAAYVLSPKEWKERFDRLVKNDARPILILQPMGPLRCVYDVGDTLPIHSGLFDAFPPELAKPYDGDPTAVVEPATLHRLESRLELLGISYGMMRTAEDYSGKLEIGRENDPPLYLCELVWPAAYSLRVHDGASDTVKFCTIVHELGHLFLRHMRSGYEQEWRRGVRKLPHAAEEFEAETVSWLVTRRLGIDNPSYRYLAHYLGTHGEIPREISVEEIMHAVHMVERVMASETEAVEFYEKYNPNFKQMRKEYRKHLREHPKGH